MFAKVIPPDASAEHFRKAITLRWNVRIARGIAIASLTRRAGRNAATRANLSCALKEKVAETQRHGVCNHGCTRINTD